MKRVFYDYRDFQKRLAASSPAHYDVELEKSDPEGLVWVQKYRIYGTDSRGTLIIYERRWIHPSVQANLRPHMVDRFVMTFAKPLNAVPGRIEVD